VPSNILASILAFPLANLPDFSPSFLIDAAAIVFVKLFPTFLPAVKAAPIDAAPAMPDATFFLVTSSDALIWEYVDGLFLAFLYVPS